MMTKSIDKYTYSSNSVSAGTSLLIELCDHAATGNAIIGIFIGGYDKFWGLHADIQKYNYALDTVVSGASLVSYVWCPAAISNNVLGVIAGGSSIGGV
ncbi:MAG: hypothetical protein ACD_84C00016G0001, partial [uncultured bacterium]